MTSSRPTPSPAQFALQKALRAQRPEAIRAAVAEGADLNAPLPGGRYPLLATFRRLKSDDPADDTAYLQRGYALLNVLFDLGARADHQTPEGGMLFHAFVRRELEAFDAESDRVHGPVPQEASLDAIRGWLDRGARVMYGIPKESTPLHHAEDMSYQEAVSEEFYLKKGWGTYVGQLITLWVEYGYPAEEVLVVPDKAHPHVAAHQPLGHLMIDQMIEKMGMMEGFEHGSLAYQMEVSRRNIAEIQITQDRIDEGLRLRDLRQRPPVDQNLDWTRSIPERAATPFSPDLQANADAQRGRDWQEDWQACEAHDPDLADARPAPSPGVPTAQEALEAALVAQDPAAVRLAVAHGADPNAPLPCGAWPLLAVFHRLPEEWGARNWARTSAEEQAFRRRGYALMKTLFELGAEASFSLESRDSAFHRFVQSELVGFLKDPARTTEAEPNPTESLAAIRMWLEHGVSPLAQGLREEGGRVEEENVLEYACHVIDLEANQVVAFTSSAVPFLRQLMVLLVEYGFPPAQLQARSKEDGDLHYHQLAAVLYEATRDAAEDWISPSRAQFATGASLALKSVAEEGERLWASRTTPMEPTTPAPRRRRLR